MTKFIAIVMLLINWSCTALTMVLLFNDA